MYHRQQYSNTSDALVPSQMSNISTRDTLISQMSIVVDCLIFTPTLYHKVRGNRVIEMHDQLGKLKGVKITSGFHVTA